MVMRGGRLIGALGPGGRRTSAREKQMCEGNAMWKWVERVKAILEILAILIAGAWAFTLYWNYESPSNVMRADLEGKLSWAGRSKDVCEADYEVAFKNIGRV